MAKAAVSQTQRSKRVAAVLEQMYGTPAKPRGRSNPLDTLIATLLSQNTNDRNSYRAWLNLKKQFPTWDSVVSAPVAAVARSIEVGGLKNQKAQRIRKILKAIRAERGSFELDFLRAMPDDAALRYLQQMKGVGTKTAACVLVFSLGRDVFPVDTHIHRICNRLGLVKTRNADQTYELMKFLTPKGMSYPFHVNLIRFGREICRSGKPFCGSCQFFDECAFGEKVRFSQNHLPADGTGSEKSKFLITEEVSRARHRRTSTGA
ncbi:MAG TPA: endonuclease III [Bacteroidota bacterium]|nr:endonuclease III [Bacteroidota bacterium]